MDSLLRENGRTGLDEKVTIQKVEREIESSKQKEQGSAEVAEKKEVKELPLEKYMDSWDKRWFRYYRDKRNVMRATGKLLAAYWRKIGYRSPLPVGVEKELKKEKA